MSQELVKTQDYLSDDEGEAAEIAVQELALEPKIEEPELPDSLPISEKHRLPISSLDYEDKVCPRNATYVKKAGPRSTHPGSWYYWGPNPKDGQNGFLCWCTSALRRESNQTRDRNRQQAISTKYRHMAEHAPRKETVPASSEAPSKLLKHKIDELTKKVSQLEAKQQQMEDFLGVMQMTLAECQSLLEAKHKPNKMVVCNSPTKEEKPPSKIVIPDTPPELLKKRKRTE